MIQRVRAIYLDKTKEQIANYTFVKILTTENYRSIKLPTNFTKYKYNHQLSFLHILELELVKTQKNWILKDILASQQWLKPTSYQDFLVVTELNKMLLNYFHEQHEVDFFLEFVNYISSQPLDSLDLRLISEKLQLAVSIFDKV